MPAVTQLVENFLGGISTQTDDKKLPGQVVEATNAYPDPTFGMLKRNGMRFVRTIDKADGSEFTKDELKDAAWFSIQRGPSEVYFGAIKGTDIYVWNAITGVFCTVTNNGTAYLTGTKQEDYQFRSIQDVTVITNKTVKPELQADPTGYTPGKVGTVVLKIVEYSANYTVTINGTNYTYKTRNADEFDTGGTNTRLNADEVLKGIKDAIGGGGGVTVTQYKTSLEITKGSAFTLDAKGGINNQALDSYQNSVVNISDLAPESYNGRTIEIINGGGDADDYWVKYNAANKEYKETRDPTVSPGFVDSTFPHELVSTDVNEFTFGPIDWTERLAGDNTTNPPPSIFDYDPKTDKYISPGNPINATFFYNNRFGMLSKDNVIFSQANDPYNFWSRSALVQVDSDPVDLNASSVRPVNLFDVLPDAQGLLLFSQRQQFLLFAGGENGVLTGATAIIRSVANYEMDRDIAPVDVGTTVAFVSKTPAYTRVFSMQTRGLEENPIVLDLTKVVSEYIPNSITNLVSSPQNSFIALVTRDEKEMYIYRYYNNGEKDLFQAWVKWTMPGDLQTFSIANDILFSISQQEDQYTLTTVSLNDIPFGTQFSQSVMSSPHLDLAQRPTSITYDAATDKTTFEVGYKPLVDKDAIMLLTVPIPAITYRTLFDLAGLRRVPFDGETDADPGYWAKLEVDGDKFTIPGDFTSYGDGIVVGYNYEFNIQLPTFYYNRSRDGFTADYTANLTIARTKISVGKTGVAAFKLKARGRDEWVDIQAVSDADYYRADTSPIVSSKTFTVPLNQRNMNFDLKITSDYPFPVSLVSMMWEGMYSPAYYKRT
jgi:hypothetical protein